MQVDVVTVGETMVSFHPVREGMLAHSPTLEWTVAGAESNVAIGLNRLGKRVRWISRLGSDPFGDIVARTIAGEGVDTSFVVRDPNAPTGLFFRETRGISGRHFYYYRRGSAASRLSPQDFRDQWLEDARHLHVTGITPALSDSARELVMLLLHKARERGMSISFDPNLRRKLWDERTARETLLAMVPLCDVFLPGIDEAEFLLGPRPIDDWGRAFLEMGPKVVALKRGAEGAIGFVAGRSVRATAFPVGPPVDCTGAGDAFDAGFISVYLDRSAGTQGEDILQAALARGNVMGALITQHRGDWEGLPTLAELHHLQSRAGQTHR